MTTVDVLLSDWMPDQRWFAGKGRPIARVGIRKLLLPDPAESSVTTDDSAAVQLYWVFADVEYTEGESETYSIPVTVRDPHSNVHPEIVIGRTDEFGAERLVCDAMRDRASSPRWLQMLGAQRSVPDTNDAVITFESIDPDAVPRDLTGDLISTEQSNSSVVYGDALIVKFFRRLETGRNPDVEIHQALAPLGNPHIAALRGSISLVRSGGDPEAESTLALAQQFLPTASDGFSLALTSARDLLADLGREPAQAGGDFASEAFRLGHATARVHTDLAQVLPTATLSPVELAQRAGAMRARLDLAVRVAPELAPYADGLRERYDALAGLDTEIPVQRVHGDFHLGQTMRTVHGWVILDFEGEPVKPISQRRELDTPLRDVAGMLRSFDYAARALLVEESGLATTENYDGLPSDQAPGEQLDRDTRAAQWRERNIDAFCAGYAEGSGADPRASAVLLQALQADKAVYEAVYEARNRPHWLRVPLEAIRELSAAAQPPIDAPDADPVFPDAGEPGFSQAELTGAWRIVPDPTPEPDVDEVRIGEASAPPDVPVDQGDHP